MDQNSFRDLLANRDGRIQCRHRILKNHGEQLATELLHIPVRIIRNVHAIGIDFAILDLCGFGQQFHDGFAEDALSAAGFAHESQHFAGIQLKAYIPDSLYFPGSRPDFHGKVFDFQ